MHLIRALMNFSSSRSNPLFALTHAPDLNEVKQSKFRSSIDVRCAQIRLTKCLMGREMSMTLEASSDTMEILIVNLLSDPHTQKIFFFSHSAKILTSVVINLLYSELSDENILLLRWVEIKERHTARCGEVLLPCGLRLHCLVSLAWNDVKTPPRWWDWKLMKSITVVFSLLVFARLQFRKSIKIPICTSSAIAHTAAIWSPFHHFNSRREKLNYELKVAAARNYFDVCWRMLWSW